MSLVVFCCNFWTLQQNRVISVVVAKIWCLKNVRFLLGHTVYRWEGSSSKRSVRGQSSWSGVQLHRRVGRRKLHGENAGDHGWPHLVYQTVHQSISSVLGKLLICDDIMLNFVILFLFLFVSFCGDKPWCFMSINLRKYNVNSPSM